MKKEEPSRWNTNVLEREPLTTSITSRLEKMEIEGTTDDDYSVMGCVIDFVDSNVESVLLNPMTKKMDQNWGTEEKRQS